MRKPVALLLLCIHSILGIRPAVGGSRPNWALPPRNPVTDYQLAGAYPADHDVVVVVRDRHDPPAGRYDVCYVNGFQAQADELNWWKSQHPNLLLKDAKGRPVVDRAWNEVLLDITTPGKRNELSNIVGAWSKQCFFKGYEAVEFDNLDSYSRSRGAITKAHAVDMATRLVTRAHREGLAVGQKNAAGPFTSGRVPFDFAVVESCSEFNECKPYFAQYGDRVIMIEYRLDAFERACRQWPGRSILLADPGLTVRGDERHLRRHCPSVP